LKFGANYLLIENIDYIFKKDKMKELESQNKAQKEMPKIEEEKHEKIEECLKWWKELNDKDKLEIMEIFEKQSKEQFMTWLKSKYKTVVPSMVLFGLDYTHSFHFSVSNRDEDKQEDEDKKEDDTRVLYSLHISKMAHVQLDSTATKCIYLSQLTHSELCDKICKVLDRSTLEMMAKMQFLMQIIGTDRAKLIETDEDVIQTFKTSKQPLFQLSWKPSLSANLNTTVRVVRNALVVMIGISEYADNSRWSNLPNIEEKDIVNFKNLFEKELNYDFVHNQEARMTKEGVKDFFSNLMLSRELHKNSMNYDALIVILCAHGDKGDVLISSDGKG
ncbi:hypothetical protein RFI_26532, partial [Reticulomyxa filosa]